MQRINPASYRLDDIRAKLKLLQQPYLDIMITGVTGAGKSASLNSLLQKTVVKVGYGVGPETMHTQSFCLNKYLYFWDTPGLGDGVERDVIHEKKIKKDLTAPWASCDNRAIIDIVVVIIEGSKRDLGTTSKLVEKVILPNISVDRVLFAINQADLAMKGRYWDFQRHIPKPQLKSFLDDFSDSIKHRILNDTGLTIHRPIYYSATENYNMNVFLDHIINNIPREKRML